MSEETQFLIGFLLIAVFGFGGLMGGLIAFSNWGSGVQCHAQWSADFDPKYDFWSGCTITVNGVRIPAANYRVL